jgi:NAD(P)-dependent dehydrogenase (short-subunit alcohol dehydrogenase family)
MAQHQRSVLVLGGFGTFGRRITEALSQSGDVCVMAAGRHVPASFGGAGGNVRVLSLDTATVDGALLESLDPTVVIDAVGPFQARDRQVARACIDLGIHYVDLADGREFVQGIGQLNRAALDRDALIVSGASTLPALSSAVIEVLAKGFSRVSEIDIGIAPGYAAPRGLATIRSVLGYAGCQIPSWRNARMNTAHGWGENLRYRYPSPVGMRNLAIVDVPDTALIPANFRSLDRLTVRAGLEVPLVHHGLRLLAALVRAGMLRNLDGKAKLMQRMARWFDRLGTDNGAMHVELRGIGLGGASQLSTWTLVAENGAGPHIPATAAVLIAKRLLELPGYAPMTLRGAMPALNLLQLHEFELEWRPLAIRTIISNASRSLDVMRLEPRQDVGRLVDHQAGPG